MNKIIPDELVHKFIILTLLFSFITYLELDAQHEQVQRDLPHVALKNQDILMIFDSIVLHETNCSYYDCNLLFSVSTETMDNETVLKIESINDINIILGLDPTGYFYHLNHLFIIDSKYYNEWFVNCKTIVTFKYIDYNKVDYTSNEAIIKYGPLLNDHSHSFWIYILTNARLTLKEKYTFCQ